MSQPNKSGPVSKVELRVECTGLKKKDEFSKSDPCAVLYMQQRGTNSWNEVQPLLVSSSYEGAVYFSNPHDVLLIPFILRWEELSRLRTIIIPGLSRPSLWTFFEEIQKVKIEVYDLDNATSKLTDDDFLGKVECNLA